MKLVSVFMVAIVLACCGTEVLIDRSPSVNFNALKKTYAFLPRVDSTHNILFNNRLIDERIQNAVTSELSKRDYRIDTKEPELMVKFHLMVENKEYFVNTPVYSYPMWYGYPYPYFYYPGPIYLGNNNRRIDYKEGTLIIDVIQRSSGNLIWRGWSVGKIDSPAKFIEQIPHLIHRMFLHYPIQPVKIKTLTLKLAQRKLDRFTDV